MIKNRFVNFLLSDVGFSSAYAKLKYFSSILEKEIDCYPYFVQKPYAVARIKSSIKKFEFKKEKKSRINRLNILVHRATVKPSTLMSKVFAYNGYVPVLDPRKNHDLAIKFQSKIGAPNINGKHVDNSKKRVADAWLEAAGYAVEVNPLCYIGLMVEKSDANATHDGRIIEGPIESDDIVEGKVYQRLIDNSYGGDVLDIRVCFVGNKIPVVYFKWRPKATRFDNDNLSVNIVDSGDVFSTEEIDKLLKFTSLFGLDYGELDVLRDNASGLIYVVDATNNAAGPPNGITPRDGGEAIARLAVAFDDFFENLRSNQPSH